MSIESNAKNTENYIDRIKQLKNEKKITNEQLSEMTGIPLSTMSKMLAGISEQPKLINVVAIARALGCSLDYLVNGDGECDHESGNRYILSPDEASMVEDFRSLDSHGKELTLLIISKEKERMFPHTAIRPTRTSRVLPTPEIDMFDTEKEERPAAKRAILLYDMPVSAGTGIDLTEEYAGELLIPNTEQTRDADFALRIKGNSMEPKFRDGDILLVHSTERAQQGELGIFVLDGAGYFKKHGGDRLLSLNPSYAPIMLSDYTDVKCVGRVIGKMYRR
ncbi:MAG: helix-turn-helix domain-containing protein [Clostridia bacterium]|nr:helix-turn-helix domain-containing protein [Clostridia bacterium]